MGGLRRRLAAVRWKKLALELAIGLGILVAIGAWQSRNLHSTGNPAPPLALKDLDGKDVRLEDYRGRKVLIYFWAPWCGVCKLQTPTVDGLVGGDAAVLSVALSYPDRASVERYVAEKDVQAPVLLGNDDTARDWSVDVYPTLYVVDEEGQIDHALVGYTTSLGLRLRLLF